MSYSKVESNVGRSKVGKSGVKYGIYPRNKLYKSVFIYLSLDICKKLEICYQDRIEFYIDKNPRKWVIKKAESNKGFKLHIHSIDFLSFSVSISKFKGIEIKEEDSKCHFAKHRFLKDNIIEIDASI